MSAHAILLIAGIAFWLGLVVGIILGLKFHEPPPMDDDPDYGEDN